MFRPLEESDLDSCVDLFVCTFAQPPWNETWEPAIVRARLDQIFRTPMSFGVVSWDTRLMGFALGVSEPWHEGSHFFLKEMCIRAEDQRQGHGTRLLDHLSSQLQAGDTTRIYLLTARGDMSEAFYTHAGFYTSPRMILMARRFELSQPANLTSE